MNDKDIKGFARKVALQEAYGGKDALGHITAMKGGVKHWLGRQGFVKDSKDARLVHFDFEQVADQIQQVAMQMGELLGFEFVKTMS